MLKLNKVRISLFGFDSQLIKSLKFQVRRIQGNEIYLFIIYK